MNEVSSFCDGSCGTGANLSNTSPFLFVVDYPEGYNATRFGPSENITVNGTHTCDPSLHAIGAGNDVTPKSAGRCHGPGPAYSLHNGNGPLSALTLAIYATHASGFSELDVHNPRGREFPGHVQSAA